MQPGGPVLQPNAIVDFIPLVRDYELGLWSLDKDKLIAHIFK